MQTNGDLDGQSDKSRSVTSVPAQYTDTPTRRRTRTGLRVAGLFFFTLTVLSVLLGGFHLLMPEVWAENTELWGTVTAVFVICFMANHVGLFLDTAGDSGGKNWFALGAGIIWLSVFGTFLVAGAWEIIKGMFS